MENSINRRDFLKLATLGSMSMGMGLGRSIKTIDNESPRVGIIGLDTSHCIAFTKILNDPQAPPELAGYPVVAAYPYGSKTIKSSYSRIPKYTRQIKQMGVKVVDSVDDLLDQVDVVLLETNDGQRHLEQAQKVFKAGKPAFIDKPLAASLADVVEIYDLADQYDVPVFSASSLRYMSHAQAIRHGKAGTLLGAETYGPAGIEPTHPDLYWMGIHGVETLFTVMGTGCRQVRRIYSKETDVVVGTWDDGKLGTFRGLRTGREDFGGTAFGEKEIAPIGPYEGYRSLLVEIVKFFRTGKAPVTPQETKEIYAFMSAADASKRRDGAPVTLQEMLAKARQ